MLYFVVTSTGFLKNLRMYTKSLPSVLLADIHLLRGATMKVVTQLSIPTHAQLQRHRLKFIKNHLKKLPDDGRMTETCRSVFKKF